MRPTLPVVAVIATMVASTAIAGTGADTNRSVYVSQIGNANRATVTQTAPVAQTTVLQRGDRNVASSAQDGAAISTARIDQQGNGNLATVEQRGTGFNDIALSQIGSGNIASARQSAETVLSAATMIQTGNDNQMSLVQSGSDNRAELAQNGDGNKMAAEQSGEGNRLAWTQQGDHLAQMAIAQTGGQTMQIIQTR